MMDLVLEAWVAGSIEAAKIAWMFGFDHAWRPGEPLRLLFAGYNGTRNTGSDVRVEEMLRQVRHVLGDANVELAVMTQNFNFTRQYFYGVRQVKLPDIFPPFLAREVPRHHGVVACEGSMFKSKFANALTIMMVGSLGIAAAQNKLSVGYGAEAGAMDPFVARLCRRYCAQSLVITRNEESQAVLNGLGVRTELGSDTAWTFEPHPPDYGRRVLGKAGWDGRAPVLVVCPIHPFWWPVKASLGKYLAHRAAGAFRESHYRSIYFHRSGPEVRAAFARYLAALAEPVRAFCARHRAFPVLVAMERLDQEACRRLAEMLGGAPVLTSDEYDMYQLVSIVRAARWMVSSRYHGIVTSMPAGVASAGVTMDERIRNLMRERGHTDLLLEADDPDLKEKLPAVMEKLVENEEAIRAATAATVVKNLKMMARMGVYFEEQVERQYPAFPVRRGPRAWEDYLPPLGASLRALVEASGE
jgi:polysaccharide pyruvyl transferase WcaK-like protein